MNKEVKTFQYISRISEPNLEDLIQSYIYNQKYSNYTELEVDSMTQPIQIGYAHYDIHDKSPKFEIIVTFNSRKLTDEEIEIVENNKDISYDLVIRKNLKGEVVLKINGKELEFNKYFNVVKPIKRIYEIDDMFNRFYENLVVPIGKILGYEPSKDRYEIKEWINYIMIQVIFFDEVVRMNKNKWTRSE